MSDFNYVYNAEQSGVRQEHQTFLTIGQVVDTNDPQQMGRLRVLCPAYGDRRDMRVRDIPWSMYVSPFGGMTNFGTRGHEDTAINGPTSYGLWNIPKIGAHVLVGVIDGDQQHRFWIGCIYPHLLTHTMPHGRFLWNEERTDPDKAPEGPVDSYELPIQPLYQNMTEQFTKNGTYYPSDTPSEPRKNMEWRTRGPDNQTSALDGSFLDPENPDYQGSEIPDQQWNESFGYTTVTEEDGTQRVIRGTGYGIDQQEPNEIYPNTGGINYDSMVYSWTTPGLHSVSMDDRNDNARIRIRTTSGHQIIMDDTNERVYINTAGGETWIELDKVGNIDIFASKDISTHAKGDINFTADKTFRVQAKEGIHMVSDDELRLHAKGDMHVKTNQTLFLSTVEETHINTGTTGYWTTGSEMNQLAGGDMKHTAPRIDFNGPAADPAESSKESFIAGRIPEHEPWPRVYSDPTTADQDQGNVFTPKPRQYTDPTVGRQDRDGQSFNRNDKWHR